MSELIVDLAAPDGGAAAAAEAVRRALREADALGGDRGRACALVASNLVGVWKKCLDARTGADAGAGASATRVNLLSRSGAAVFELPAGATRADVAATCAATAQAILSAVFGDAALARWMANHLRGSDAKNEAATSAAIAAFGAAHEKLSELNPANSGVNRAVRGLARSLSGALSRSRSPSPPASPRGA